MEAADLAAPLDQREHDGLLRDVVFPILGATADIGPVSLDNPVFSTERAAVIAEPEFGHCFANAIPEEPCGFHTATERSLKLASADAFLARAHQVDSLKPYAQWHVARLHDGTDFDSERFAAGVALAQTGARRFPFQPSDILFGCAAVRANGTVRPESRFDESVSSFFVMKMRARKDRVDDRSP